jgi:aspartate aminotransferase-like enzyme
MDATIRWGTTQSQPILMIPGPTELPFPVVQAMSQPATIQYDLNFDVKILEPVTLALRDIFQTKPKAVSMVHNETSTGTTYPAAEVGRIVKRHGALFMLDTVSSLAGLDVRTDDWGVDFNMTGSQKCLAAPLGLAVVSVSPAAWEAMERRKHKSSSWAYDLLRWKENWIPASRGGHIPDGSPRRQPVSIPTHLTSALGVASRLILEEGLAHRFRRHAVAGRAFRAGLEAMRLELFPDASLLSNTVSCFKAPAGVEPAAVVSHMRDRYGILIGTGLDKIRTTTLRVGHMGITSSPMYVLPTLSAIEMTLRDLGYRSEAGAGVSAAQAVFSSPPA